jgi:uncharacterized protein YhaN
MQQIADAKSQEDNLLPRFYAASAGLEVDPGAVRKAIGDSMEALWKKNGSTPALNRMKAERERVRVEARALEAEAETLRSDAARLETLEAGLETARALRTETDVRGKTVARGVDKADRLLGEAEAAERDAKTLDEQVAVARSNVSALIVDARALAAADTVDALAEELSGFRAQTGSLTTGEAQIASLDARLRMAVAETGWSVDAALAAASDAGAGAEIDAARDRLFRAAERLEMATAARDAARAEETGVESGEGKAGRPWLVAGLAIAAVGIVGAVAGVVASQAAVAIFGALLAGAGLIAAFLVRTSPRVQPGGASRTRVATADAAHAAAEGALDIARRDWAAWVVAHSLGEGAEEPAAVAARYQAAKAVRSIDAERTELLANLTRVRACALAYSNRVGEVVAPLVGEPSGSATLDRAGELVIRARSLVGAARTAAAAQREALATVERLEREAAARRAVGAQSTVESSRTLEGIAAATIDEARVLLVQAESAAEDAAGEFERVLQDATALRARLGSERRDTALAELRLTEESLGERIAAGVSEYAVMAVAGHMLALAQERFELERKGPIVERAEAALAAMTGGRYARISVPMGKDAIEVFSGASAAISPEDLSRGTAEQLYLALRLGLIEQSGHVGAYLPVLMDDILVNFSPARAEQAARAIADLATRRQVVFFTCHPATADLLCSVDPEAVRLELAPPA